jgi:aryl-alcohol dehydrogenase-like predicted oxidoreductase
LMEGGCVEAIEQLRHQGKILHWGLSLNTFHPAPEAEYMIERKIGQSFQLVLNIVNQRAIPVLRKAREHGYGIITRMPLQFGLLTGKFTRESRFSGSDHRSFRLAPGLLDRLLTFFEQSIRPLAERHHMTPTAFALGFCLSFPEVSTVIPGIKTPEQAAENTGGVRPLSPADRDELIRLHAAAGDLVELMEKKG